MTPLVVGSRAPEQLSIRGPRVSRLPTLHSQHTQAPATDRFARPERPRPFTTYRHRRLRPVTPSPIDAASTAGSLAPVTLPTGLFVAHTHSHSPPHSFFSLVPIFGHCVVVMTGRGRDDGGAAGADGSGCAAPAPSPGTAPLPEDGTHPVSTINDSVAQVRRLCGLGFPPSAASAAVGSELVGGDVSVGGLAVEDRVMDRALDHMRLRGGPVFDVGRARNEEGGVCSAGRVEEEARGRHGVVGGARDQGDSGGGAARGSGSEASGAVAAGADAEDDVIVVTDGERDTDRPPPATGARSARGDASSSIPTAAANSGDGVIVAVDDGDSQSATDAAGSTPAADEYGWPMVDRVGTHQQTAADLLRSFPTSGTTEAPTRNSSGLALAPKPLALTYPHPPSLSGPRAAEVFLLVDDRETAGNGPARRSFLAKLRVNPGLADRVLTRRLPTGDAVLVARVTAAGAAAFDGAPAAGTELMLDVLVERKTVADPVSSLEDGRMPEQAYFMEASGCRLQVLVVEGDVHATLARDRGMLWEVNKLLSTLAVSTNVFIQHTANIQETVIYYSALVRIRGDRLGTGDGLANWLQHHSVKGDTASGRGILTYSLWEKHAKLMRGEISLQQLWALQLDIVPGVGLVRIDYIMEAGFTTPASLAAAYAKVSCKEDGEMLLARVPAPPGGSRISKTVSEYMYNLFTSKDYAGL